MIKTVQTIDGIDEHEFGYNAKIEGYTNSSSDTPELAEISNSPSRRKGNLNHQKKRGLASFNQETRGKNINQIVTQPGITEVKWLRKAKTKIFNNRRGGEFGRYEYMSKSNTATERGIYDE